MDHPNLLLYKKYYLQSDYGISFANTKTISLLVKIVLGSGLVQIYGTLLSVAPANLYNPSGTIYFIFTRW